MSKTIKQISQLDYQQTLQGSFNEVDASHNIAGFLVPVVGRKIDLAIATTNVGNDTEIYTFTENGSALYTLTIVYTDSLRTLMISAERTA